jgi:aspartate carbamoyltransferase catalytic subunit
LKHLISAADLSLDETLALLDTAEEMSNVNDREIKKLPTLRGRTVVNLFFEDSTRTRISFELAAKRLSADVIAFTAKGSSVSKGESLKDTAQTLEAMGAEAVIVRHHASGAAQNLATAGWISAHVVNAGDGKHEHPTQALLDAFTIRKRLHGAGSTGKNLAGVRVLIVGDVLHSRVARSNLHLLRTLGARVAVAAPATLLPATPDALVAEHYFDLDEAIAKFKPDAVMMLRVQLERMSASFFPSAQEYSANWGLTRERAVALPATTLIMHPGPMNRGLEISSYAADAPQSTVLDQVRNGISVRMSTLYHLMAGDQQ